MLRITVHENPRSVTFQLEGRLAGSWVQVLAECWRNALARQPEPIVRVDLTGVTYVDAEGKACLAELHRQGDQLVATDCLMNGIVDEITRRDSPGCQGDRAIIAQANSDAAQPASGCAGSRPGPCQPDRSSPEKKPA